VGGGADDEDLEDSPALQAHSALVMKTVGEAVLASPSSASSLLLLSLLFLYYLLLLHYSQAFFFFTTLKPRVE